MGAGRRQAARSQYLEALWRHRSGKPRG